MLSAGKVDFGLDCENPEALVTSQWQRETKQSKKYLIYRWIFAFYFIFVTILSLSVTGICKQLTFYAIYLTNWNVWLNGISALLGAVLVTLHHRGRFKFEGVGKKMPIAFKWYWILSTCSISASATISLVYWIFIHTGRDSGINNFLTHGGNALVLFVDIFIHAHPPRFGHFIYPLGLGFIYSFLFSLPYTLLGGTNRDYSNFIYDVADWREKPTNALIFSLSALVFLAAMHCLLTSFGVLRSYLHRKIIEAEKPDTETAGAGGVDNRVFYI